MYEVCFKDALLPAEPAFFRGDHTNANNANNTNNTNNTNTNKTNKEQHEGQET